MKFFFLSLFACISNAALACPYCNDSVPSNGGMNSSTYTLVIIAIFVALSYIPFYILFRAAKKYEPKEIDGNK